MQDPFNIYGFGIVTMFDLFRVMIFVFAIGSLLALTMMWINHSGTDNGVYNNQNLSFSTAVTVTTLGNLGQATNVC